VARVYTAYMDESYSDGILMCVGGWLCRDDVWRRIENQWNRRIEYEQRRSIKRAERPITRYHASALDNFRHEYKIGWGDNRKVLFTKKLIDILGREKRELLNPFGIVSGIEFPHILEAFPGSDEKGSYKFYWAAYRICMIECLITLADTMRRFFAGGQVAVIYDRGPFSSAAQSAFDSFKAGNAKNKTDIVTMAPMDWQQCTALQPADMIAYEGRKLIKGGHQTLAQVRRSFKRLIGNGNIVRVRPITKNALLKIAEARILAPNPPPDIES
jgi:hypothetical protein